MIRPLIHMDAYFFLHGKNEKAIVVYGDMQCPYDRIVFLTDMARTYGINYIAFYVKDQEQETSPAEQPKL